ncbi:potassium transporter CPA [Platysternon megacephalum]|uniref:Potassium transporter CPA n=1 Tax=Platysternon megacephalum TaxID=55544 RepID=A0A4D9DMQ3_9SAUR|nr:potassium transporter CPA [Platysternon megacephalum]
MQAASSDSACDSIMALNKGTQNYYNSTYRGRITLSDQLHFTVKNASEWMAGEYQVIKGLYQTCMARIYLTVTGPVSFPLPISETPSAREGTANLTGKGSSRGMLSSGSPERVGSQRGWRWSQISRVFLLHLRPAELGYQEAGGGKRRDRQLWDWRIGVSGFCAWPLDDGPTLAHLSVDPSVRAPQAREQTPLQPDELGPIPGSHSVVLSHGWLFTQEGWAVPKVNKQENAGQSALALRHQTRHRHQKMEDENGYAIMTLQTKRINSTQPSQHGSQGFQAGRAECDIRQAAFVSHLKQSLCDPAQSSPADL